MLALVLALSAILAVPDRPYDGSSAAPHDGLHEKIVAVTKLIAAKPDRPDLFLQRSDLYRRHRDWDLALADIEHAAGLSPRFAALDFERGKVYRDLGWLNSAAISLDRFLAHEPRHLLALRARAELARLRAEPAAAVAFYDRLIEANPGPPPDDYLARADAELEHNPERQLEALAGVERGIERLGPAVPLLTRAIELERELGRWESALCRIERLAEMSPRKESFHAWRGDLLLQADRPAEAAAAYHSCLEAVRALRPRQRQTRAIQELERRVHLALESLEATDR